MAGVYFDRHTGETGDEFCMSIDIDSCKELGFKESESTRKWWSEQNQDVLNAILKKSSRAEYVMAEFEKFLSGAEIVWSHATFDFVIVQNYLRKLGLRQMPFRGARDIRTLVDLSGINLDSYDWSNKTHNALDDCKFQIKYCVDAINAIGQS